MNISNIKYLYEQLYNNIDSDLYLKKNKKIYSIFNDIDQYIVNIIIPITLDDELIKQLISTLKIFNYSPCIINNIIYEINQDKKIIYGKDIGILSNFYYLIIKLDNKWIFTHFKYYRDDTNISLFINWCRMDNFVYDFHSSIYKKLHLLDKDFLVSFKTEIHKQYYSIYLLDFIINLDLSYSIISSNSFTLDFYTQKEKYIILSLFHKIIITNN